uniref:Sulfotransferase domain-containing protein n=1 Tax=viral metagenome TaxID=1070528 RepID=A0A6C0KXT1_9ZZZZ|tara:strand:+ start:3817 stop:4401 length:585 start_codon:yes stop_codon:yes gene_type:complete
MILLIGFPKSGTLSFYHLFKKLGYKTIHWCKGGGLGNNHLFIGRTIQKNKQKGLPLLNSLTKPDAITQMDVCISKTKCYWPQLVDYKQLYYENEDAIFILNKRDPHKILASFKRKGLHNRLYKFNPELIDDKTDEGFINFVKKHYKDVEDFFETQENAKFISYDIENDDIQKLSKYINIKNIDTFPRHNVSKNK